VPSWCTNSSGRIAGQHDVQPGEALAGVRRPGDLADLAVEGVPLRLRVGRGLLGEGDGSLLLLQLDLGFVELLADDLQLVAGFGDELGGPSGVGHVTGIRGSTAREDGEGQGCGDSQEEPGAEPSDVSGRLGDGRRGGGGLFEGVRQYDVWGRHERRLSVLPLNRLPS